MAVKFSKKIGGTRYYMRGGRHDTKRGAEAMARQYRSQHKARVVSGRSPITNKKAYWVFVADQK
jgi:hypothetical protein